MVIDAIVDCKLGQVTTMLKCLFRESTDLDGGMQLRATLCSKLGNSFVKEILAFTKARFPYDQIAMELV